MDMKIKNVKDCYGACNDTSFHVFLGFKFMSSEISFRLIPLQPGRWRDWWTQAYKQADYDTMKANISICSTIIGDASCLISFAWEWYATSLSICLCPENYVEVQICIILMCI